MQKRAHKSRGTEAQKGRVWVWGTGPVERGLNVPSLAVKLLAALQDDGPQEISVSECRGVWGTRCVAVFVALAANKLSL